MTAFDPKSLYDLTGQVALVTGGGTGIGLAVARCLAVCGARVILAGRRKEPLMEACRQIGSSASYQLFDVTDFKGAKSLVERVATDHGSLDILVNNAGVHLKEPAETVDEEAFIRLLNVHLVGAHALSRHAVVEMRKRGGGCILYMASMASLFGIPKVIAYTAAKTAIVGVVKGLSTEWGEAGIRINAIAPGWIETEMSKKALAGDPERKLKILGRTPLKRFGSPEDIGWAAVYLASPAASFITGICLPVDGGASIGF